MLINTVVLFLRDTLPIFLLISVLLALPGVTRKSLLVHGGVLIVLALITYSHLSWISEFADGIGFELFKSFWLVVAWIGMCFIALLLPSRLTTNHIGVALLVLGIGLPNSLHFMVYFVSELTRNNDSSLLLLGTTIGLGICVSIAILLNIVLTHFLTPTMTYFFTSLFVAAQVANVALLLEQIDIFPAPYQIWDSSRVVSDNSEYGHLLNALIGYEATPSVSYLVLFIVTFCVPVVISVISKSRHSREMSKEAAQ
ncbi:hypothetical protein D210916BOD24_04190 [Alteromonas sp. D210916BOD_24]|uniref:FTR1 family iron permease n=1 Tax=Alteromonas sp. D210916BOD_24 TaxID=3157618 RepID=UPI00399CFC0E